MEKKKKSVLKIGNSLGLSLSELKSFGIKRGDKVNVFVDDGKILVDISDDYLSVFKPVGIDNDEWDEFISTVLRSRRLKKLKREERILQALREALRKWIEDEKSLYIKLKL